MSYTVGDCITEAQALLNDQAGQLFTSTILLPYFKKAHDELGWRLDLSDVPVLFEAFFEFPDFPPGTTDLLPLPADFVEPIELHEKPAGSLDPNYTLIVRVTFLPDLTPDESFNFWSYTANDIHVIGNTTTRHVRMRYRYLIPTITGLSNPVIVVNAKTYLSSRTAALAAFTIGENPDRASALQADADSALDTLIRMSVKNNQSLRTRRRPNTIGPWFR
jgi:hypothetical protein